MCWCKRFDKCHVWIQAHSLCGGISSMSLKPCFILVSYTYQIPLKLFITTKKISWHKLGLLVGQRNALAPSSQSCFWSEFEFIKLPTSDYICLTFLHCVFSNDLAPSWQSCVWSPFNQVDKLQIAHSIHFYLCLIEVWKWINFLWILELEIVISMASDNSTIQEMMNLKRYQNSLDNMCQLLVNLYEAGSYSTKYTKYYKYTKYTKRGLYWVTPPPVGN